MQTTELLTLKEMMELKRAELSLITATTIEELGKALESYCIAYAGINSANGSYPSLTDLQRRYHHITKRITGKTSLRAVLDAAYISDPSFPVVIVRQGLDGVSLVIPNRAHTLEPTIDALQAFRAHVNAELGTMVAMGDSQAAIGSYRDRALQIVKLLESNQKITLEQAIEMLQDTTEEPRID